MKKSPPPHCILLHQVFISNLNAVICKDYSYLLINEFSELILKIF